MYTLIHQSCCNLVYKIGDIDCRLDDWGVAADIARYRKLDDDLSCINAEIEWLEAEAGAARIAKTICKG